MSSSKTFRYLLAGLLFVSLCAALWHLTSNTTNGEGSVIAEQNLIPTTTVIAPSSTANDNPKTTVLEKLLDQSWPDEDFQINESSVPIHSREQFMRTAASAKTNQFNQIFSNTYLSPIDEQGRYIVLSNHRAFEIRVDRFQKDTTVFLHHPKTASHMEAPVVRTIMIEENSAVLSHGTSNSTLASIENEANTAEEGIEIQVSALSELGNYLIQVEPVHALATGPSRYFLTLTAAE